MVVSSRNVSPDLFREPFPDGAGSDGHGPPFVGEGDDRRTATAVILVRVEGEGQYPRSVAATGMRMRMPSRCSTSSDTGSRGPRCRAATRNVRPKSGWEGSTTVGTPPVTSETNAPEDAVLKVAAVTTAPKPPPSPSRRR